MKTVWLLMGLALVSAAGAQPALDDDDLNAALDEVSAAGGLVDPGDLEPWWSADGTVRSVTRWQEGGQLSTDLRVEVERGGLGLGGRWRQQDPAPVALAWAAWVAGAQRVGVGAVGYQHGLGLLSAAAGARSRLDAGSSLAGRRPGWRPTLSAAAASRLEAVWWELARAAVNLHGGVGRDLDGRSARLLSASVTGPVTVRGLWVDRDQRQGGSLALELAREAWRLGAEAARWTGGAQAAAAAAAYRAGGWTVEGQAGWARANEAMAGALRPASLWGWRGQGWAVRGAGRPLEPIRASLLLAGARKRDPDRARGDVAVRSRVELCLNGRRWRLRWRHDEEAVTAWLEDAPWLPPVEGTPRTVRWLTASVRQPVAAGEVLVDWRRRQDHGGTRHLLTVGWRRDLGTVRCQLRGQMAWGDPVDLVSLSVPGRGIYLVQHWGQWDGGAWLAIRRNGGWGWQVVLVRRLPRRGTAATAVHEAYVGLQASF